MRVSSLRKKYESIVQKQKIPLLMGTVDYSYGGIRFSSRKAKQAGNFMKMLISVAQDLRVIIIKFADRLHNMRTINKSFFCGESFCKEVCFILYIF